MFCDAHVHLREKCSGGDVLKLMDKVGIERILLFSKYMPDSPETQKESVDMVAAVCAADPARLIPFVYIEPTTEGAADTLAYGFDEKGIRGVKMIPRRWYPYEERLFPVYRLIEERRKPLLFHSGILWGKGATSRFCRPTYYEAMSEFPKLKFALAHSGWPWTDETVAVYGKFRSHTRPGGQEMQMFVDVTPGAPPLYHRDIYHKLLTIYGPDQLIFGTDRSLPSPDGYAGGIEWFEIHRRILLEELEVGEETFAKIMRTNIDKFLAPMA